MIPHFTKRIEVGNEYVNFYFDRIYTIEGTRVYVSLIDKESRNVIMFIMCENEGRWSIIDPQNYSDWLIELEPRLSEIISAHLNGEDQDL